MRCKKWKTEERATYKGRKQMTVMAGAFNGRTCVGGANCVGGGMVYSIGAAILWSWPWGNSNSIEQLWGCIALCSLRSAPSCFFPHPFASSICVCICVCVCVCAFGFGFVLLSPTRPQWKLINLFFSSFVELKITALIRLALPMPLKTTRAAAAQFSPGFPRYMECVGEEGQGSWGVSAAVFTVQLNSPADNDYNDARGKQNELRKPQWHSYSGRQSTRPRADRVTERAKEQEG